MAKDPTKEVVGRKVKKQKEISELEKGISKGLKQRKVAAMPRGPRKPRKGKQPKKVMV